MDRVDCCNCNRMENNNVRGWVQWRRRDGCTFTRGGICTTSKLVAELLISQSLIINLQAYRNPVMFQDELKCNSWFYKCMRNRVARCKASTLEKERNHLQFLTMKRVSQWDGIAKILSSLKASLSFWRKKLTAKKEGEEILVKYDGCRLQ